MITYEPFQKYKFACIEIMNSKFSTFYSTIPPPKNIMESVVGAENIISVGRNIWLDITRNTIGKPD